MILAHHYHPVQYAPQLFDPLPHARLVIPFDRVVQAFDGPLDCGHILN